jgi:hypothetical protein
MIKAGSKWSNVTGQEFRVLDVVELEGHTWVHYIKENAPEDDIREYSCYIESFLQRFREQPND